MGHAQNLLVAAAQRGEVAAFNQFVREHQALTYRVAFHILGDTEQATNATQAAVETAFRTIGRWNGQDFKLWLLRILIQQCRAPLRRYPAPTQERFESPVQLGLAALPPRERMICVLADIAGLSDDDVAKIVNASVGEVKIQRSRARRQMRDVLQI